MLLISNIIILFYIHRPVSTYNYDNNSSIPETPTTPTYLTTINKSDDKVQPIHKIKCDEYERIYFQMRYFGGVPVFSSGISTREVTSSFGEIPAASGRVSAALDKVFAASQETLAASDRVFTFSSQGPAVSGGEPAAKYEFSHMVSLGYKNHKNGTLMHLCGGTLISDEYVLTAAHCLHPIYFSSDQKFIRTVRLAVKYIHEGRDFGVSEFIRHPDYNPLFRYHDIALVKLDRKVPFSFIILPACLKSGFNDSLTTTLTATGWGSTVHGGPFSDVLIKVELFVHNDCNNIYNNTKDRRRLPNGIDTKTQICAWGQEYRDRDTCEGDSGGPLGIQKKTGLFEIIGLTSFGKACGLGAPGVYTKISPYIPWIEEIVWQSL